MLCDLYNLYDYNKFMSTILFLALCNRIFFLKYFIGTQVY